MVIVRYCLERYPGYPESRDSRDSKDLIYHVSIFISRSSLCLYFNTHKDISQPRCNTFCADNFFTLIKRDLHLIY